MDHISTAPLFKLTLDVGPPFDLRHADGKGKYIFHVTGGSFDGDRLRGRVLPVSGDWVIVEKGYARVDVRLLLQTEDDVLIYMTYRGIHTLGAAHRERLAAGQALDPASYYFRTAPMFETAAPAYDWLNRVVSVGVGERTLTHVEYNVFEVL